MFIETNFILCCLCLKGPQELSTKITFFMLINIHFYRTELFVFVIWYNRPEQHTIVSDCIQILSYISLIYNYGAVCKFCVVCFLSIICFPLLFSNYSTYVFNILFVFFFLDLYFCFSVLHILRFVLFLLLYIAGLSYFCTSLPTTATGCKPSCSKQISHMWCTSHGRLNTVCCTAVTDSNTEQFERNVSNSAGLCRHV